MTSAELSPGRVTVEQVIAGAGKGGAGVLTCLKTLAYAASGKGWEIAYSSNYNPETRGGLVEGCVVISGEGPVVNPVQDSFTAVLAFDEDSYRTYGGRLRPGGLIVWDSSRIRSPAALTGVDGIRSYGVPVFALADKAGAAKLANMVMLGLYNKITGMFSIDELIGGMQATLAPWRQQLIPHNRRVLEAAMQIPVDEFRITSGYGTSAE